MGGWYQNLAETYDKMSLVTGVSGDCWKPLVPIYFIAKPAQIKIIIERSIGEDNAEIAKFVSAELIQKDLKTKQYPIMIIPSRGEAEARSGNAEAFPLNELLGWCHKLNKEEYFDAYKKQLGNFKDNSNGNPNVAALYSYINGETLEDDLIFDAELFKNKNELKEHSKDFVRFVIRYNGIDTYLDKDRDIKTAWVNLMKPKNTAATLCYDLGYNDDLLTDYPKIQGNAKILSANDDRNFVFRGRFKSSGEAFALSKANALKVHKMLANLMENVGLRVDKQIILTWAIDNSPQIEQPYNASNDFWDEMQELTVKTDNDKLIEAKSVIGVDYAEKIRNALLSLNSDITSPSCKIAIMALDAVTSGRMSITFYQEFERGRYYRKIADWHNSVKWEIPYRKKEKDEKGKERTKYPTFIGCPSIDDIISAVYGKGASDKSYGKIKKSARERLIHCIFTGESLPQDMLTQSFYRASNPLALEGKTSKNSNAKWFEWNKTLGVACALYRKKHYEIKKEEISMTLDETRTDRDYLFGRLIAVAEKIEQTARYRQGNREDARPTVACCYMNTFVAAPFQTWKVISQQIQPYKQMLDKQEFNGSGYYQRIIDDITMKFQDDDFERKGALGPLYLLGYSAQRKRFDDDYNKNKDKKGEKKDE
jgi:CRISPR-associated protein Csd1